MTPNVWYIKCVNGPLGKLVLHGMMFIQAGEDPFASAGGEGGGGGGGGGGEIIWRGHISARLHQLLGGSTVCFPGVDMLEVML